MCFSTSPCCSNSVRLSTQYATVPGTPHWQCVPWAVVAVMYVRCAKHSKKHSTRARNGGHSSATYPIYLGLQIFVGRTCSRSIHLSILVLNELAVRFNPTFHIEVSLSSYQHLTIHILIPTPVSPPVFIDTVTVIPSPDILKIAHP